MKMAEQKMQSGMNRIITFEVVYWTIKTQPIYNHGRE